MSTVLERLAYDGDKEFIRVCELILSGRGPVFFAGMQRHFEVAKHKPASFTDHGTVLAISIGGTNIKIMLACMQHGRMVASHVRTMSIPEKPTGFDVFFDDVLLKDPAVFRYMSENPLPEVGVSFPMAVIGDVAYHQTKVPTLNGVIARDFERDAPTHDFRRNFADYLERRGLPPAALFFQGDGIVAHHGAVSLSTLEPGDKSSLIICGTGMATGDEENYIQLGIMNLLDYDEELYPAGETEKYQYHYAVAGKGLFGLMDRAIRLKSKERGSLLGRFDLSACFSSSVDTKTVADIYKSSHGFERTAKAAWILEMVGADAYRELQEIATAIMERAARSVANSFVATIVKMKPAANGKGHKLFFEGSICVDPGMLPKIKRHIVEIIKDKSLFDALGEPQPYIPDMEATISEVCAADSSVNLGGMDVTLIGTASMIMAYTSKFENEGAE